MFSSHILVYIYEKKKHPLNNTFACLQSPYKDLTFQKYQITHEDALNQQYIKRRYSPVVKLETWTPVWCTEKRLHGTCQINEAVAHKEEHGQQWSQ